MPPTIQAFMNKLTANERMAVWGAVIVAIASIFASGWLSLIGAIVVIVVYWLKYSPTSNMTWPAPIQLITLAISGLILLFALLGLLGAIGLSGIASFGFFGGMFIVYLVAAIATAIGAVMMTLGTWREYQAMPKATPPAPPAPPTAPPAA